MITNNQRSGPWMLIHYSNFELKVSAWFHDFPSWIKRKKEKEEARSLWGTFRKLALHFANVKIITTSFLLPTHFLCFSCLSIMISLFLLILLYSHYCQPQNIFIPKIAENYECGERIFDNFCSIDPQTPSVGSTRRKWTRQRLATGRLTVVLCAVGLDSVPRQMFRYSNCRLISKTWKYSKEELKCSSRNMLAHRSLQISKSCIAKFVSFRFKHFGVGLLSVGTYFAFNTGLKELSFPNLKSIDCPFYAYNNTILNAVSFCDKFEDTVEMFVYDNFKNCRGDRSIPIFRHLCYRLCCQWEDRL